MRDKEKAKNYNALYRKQHWFAIKLKNQIYRSLSHVKERRREYNRTSQRKAYFKKYYHEHKAYFRKNAAEWLKNNPEKRKLSIKKYTEKIKKRRALRRAKLHRRAKIKRVLQEFLEYSTSRFSEETIRLYKMNLGRLVRFIEEKDKIRFVEEINRDFTSRYVNYVNCEEVNKIGALLGQPEKEARLYPLKSFLRFCQRKGFIKKDLRKFIFIPPREKKVQKRLLTPDEMQRFLNTPDKYTVLGIRDRAMLELLYSGLRAEELLSLNIKNVDLVDNRLTILAGKGDKDRIVPMTSLAIYWIQRWLNRRQEFIKRHGDPGLLFISVNGRRIERKSLSLLIKKYAKRANIDLDISPHDLRRITATHLAENGAPVRLIQALLGHTTLKVTTKYLRLSNEKIKAEYKKSHPANRRKLHYGAIPR